MDWCYISSGTWSLMGVEVPEPVIDDRVQELNFTNEAGAGGRIRFLKNIAGMWLLRGVPACLGRTGAGVHIRAARPNGGGFGRPARTSMSMRSCIRAECPRRSLTGAVSMASPCPNRTPRSRGRFYSLAVRYKSVLDSLERILGRRLEVIHIVGGGSRTMS